MISDVLTAALGFVIGYWFAYQFRKIREALNSIKDSLLERPKTRPTVTSGNPTLVRPDRSTAVISPKSPQRIDFEENEELRRMNPGL